MKFSALFNCLPLIMDIVLVFLVKDLNLYLEPLDELENDQHEDDDETSV